MIALNHLHARNIFKGFKVRKTPLFLLPHKGIQAKWAYSKWKVSDVGQSLVLSDSDYNSVQLICSWDCCYYDEKSNTITIRCATDDNLCFTYNNLEFKFYDYSKTT